MTTPAPDFRRAQRAKRDRSTHFVYEIYDALDQPLYVGCSVNPASRLAEHARRDWWAYVHTVRMTSYPNRAAGLRAELELIHVLAPPHNTQGLSRERLLDRA